MSIAESPFPIHPVNLSTADLQKHGQEIFQIAAVLRDTATKNAPKVDGYIVDGYDGIILNAFQTSGYSWYMPTFVFMFQGETPFTFVLPGDLKAWGPIIHTMIKDMDPLCMVVAIPNGEHIEAYMQHSVTKVTRHVRINAPFMCGTVPEDVHYAYSQPFDRLPAPLPDHVAECKQFADFMMRERKNMDKGDFKFRTTQDIRH